MNEFWPVFLRPWWLLLFPLLAWLAAYLYRQQNRTGRWQQLLPAVLQEVLLVKVHGRAGRWRWLMLGAGWSVAILALAGPSWQQYEQPARKPFAPLVIMLELTPQMLANDGTPNRLQHAKHKILDLLEARHGAQTAIVVFAGSAHTLVPLSQDIATTRNLLDALSPSIMPAAGHRVDLALHQALKLVEQGAQGRGDFLLMTTELTSQDLGAIRQFRDRKALRILGVGTPQGAPVISEQGHFLRDADGSTLISRLEHAAISRFANAQGILYQPIHVDEQDLINLKLTQPARELHTTHESVRLHIWLDQGYWLILPLLAIAALAGRRGWIFMLVICIAQPAPVYAMSLADLWLRPDQQGARALRNAQPLQAAQHFEDPLWQGYALFAAGHYQEAAERFASVDTAHAHYNRGTALAADEQFEAALEAFAEALALSPELTAAQYNQDLVEKALAARKANDTQAPETAPTSTPVPSLNNPGDLESSQETAPSPETEPDSSSDAATSLVEPSQPSSETSTAVHQTSATEHAQSLEQWLRQVPDNPGELLQRKFLLELQQRQGEQP